MAEETGKQKNKWTAVALAVILGQVGVHKFYLGHPRLGILYIALTCTIIGGAFTFWGSVAEGIIYGLKRPQDFHRIYVEGGRAMF